MHTPRILTLILVAVLLAACGKKGALYLPDAPPAPPAQEESRPK
jgi:predicted small lipoprotein YifL